MGSVAAAGGEGQGANVVEVMASGVPEDGAVTHELSASERQKIDELLAAATVGPHSSAYTFPPLIRTV